MKNTFLFSGVILGLLIVKVVSLAGETITLDVNRDYSILQVRYLIERATRNMYGARSR